MELEELRLNNLVFYNGGQPDDKDELTIIDWEDIKWIQEDRKGFNKVHKPIPLTKKWIKKCGFRELWIGSIDAGINQLEINDKLMFQTARSPKIVEGDVLIMPVRLRFWDSVYEEIAICYVHQLQNLYSALCGQELKITKDE
jgi:hypothetical protein